MRLSPQTKGLLVATACMITLGGLLYATCEKWDGDEYGILGTMAPLIFGGGVITAWKGRGGS